MQKAVISRQELFYSETAVCGFSSKTLPNIIMDAVDHEAIADPALIQVMAMMATQFVPCSRSSISRSFYLMFIKMY